MNLLTWISNDHASVASRFQSAIVQHVPTQYWSQTPPGGGSSLTWLLFHMTYHQDLALNTAVRNQPPILAEHRQALGLDGFAAASGLSEAEDPAVTAAISVQNLRNYFDQVTASSATWISNLSSLALDSVPDAPWRLERKAAVAPHDVPWLFSMWIDKPVAWFVQWECIGHCHTHLGEMTSVRNRLGLSPF